MLCDLTQNFDRLCSVLNIFITFATKYFAYGIYNEHIKYKAGSVTFLEPFYKEVDQTQMFTVNSARAKQLGFDLLPKKVIFKNLLL